MCCTGQVQIWRQADVESMVVTEFHGYSVKDMMTNADLGYVQLNHQTNGSCVIKVLSLSSSYADVVDSINLRGEDETWTIPKVWEYSFLNVLRVSRRH